MTLQHLVLRGLGSERGEGGGGTRGAGVGVGGGTGAFFANAGGRQGILGTNMVVNTLVP